MIGSITVKSLDAPNMNGDSFDEPHAFQDVYLGAKNSSFHSVLSGTCFLRHCGEAFYLGI